MRHVPQIGFKHNKPITTRMETCYYPTLCWKGTTSVHPLSECMAWRGGGVGFPLLWSVRQPRPTSTTLWGPRWFPTYFLLLCQGHAESHSSLWGWTTPVTSSLVSQPKQTNHRASQYSRLPRQSHSWSPLTVMRRDPSTWGSIFSLLRVSTSVS